MRFTASILFTHAMTLRRPPHFMQARTSVAKTRLSKSAHGMREGTDFFAIGGGDTDAGGAVVVVGAGNGCLSVPVTLARSFEFGAKTPW